MADNDLFFSFYRLTVSTRESTFFFPSTNEYFCTQLRPQWLEFVSVFFFFYIFFSWLFFFFLILELLRNNQQLIEHQPVASSCFSMRRTRGNVLTYVQRRTTKKKIRWLSWPTDERGTVHTVWDRPEECQGRADGWGFIYPGGRRNAVTLRPIDRK